MLVFVDESGDSGLKPIQGSSKYFVVTLIIFEENEDAETLDKRIGLLKQELHLNPWYEFKFNKCNYHFRTQFFKVIAPYNFFYLGIILNKSKLYGDGFKYNGSFYKYTTSLVFENAKPYLHKATVVIDGSGTKDFRRELETYLKRKINTEASVYIKKVKMENSASNNLIQLADMVSGALFRSLSKKKDAHIYRSMIAHRELYVQMWPK